VAVRNADHLRDLGMDAFTTRPEVAHLETSLIFEYVRSPGIPLYRPGEPEGAEWKRKPRGSLRSRKSRGHFRKHSEGPP
jgi:hypothetical protein